MNYFRIHFLKNKRTHIKYALATLGTKIFLRLKIFGNTTQETTTGKNLYDYSNKLMPSLYGLNTILLEDGTFEVTGVPTKNYVGISYPLNITDLLEDGQKYTLVSISEELENLYVQVRAAKKDGSGYIYIYTLQPVINFTVNKNAHSSYEIYIQSGRQSDWGNETKTIKGKFMLYKGSGNDAFEPYTGAQPSPNPDYPQEIESVEDKTKNLLKPISLTAKNNITPVYRKDGTLDYLLLNGTYSSTTIYNISDKNNPLYSDNMVMNGIANGSTTTFKLQAWRTDVDTTIGEDFGNGVKLRNGYNFYVRLVIYAGTYENVKVYPMIYKGDNLNEPYEPYYEGYKIPVNVRSENLFGFGKSAIDKTNVYRGSEKQRLILSRGSNDNEVKCNYNNGTYSQGFIEINGVNGTLNYNITFKISENTTNYTPTIYKSSSQSNENKLVVIINGKNDSTGVSSENYFILSDIQIVEGSTAKPYQPYYNTTSNIYLDQPLRKIGDYADYIDWKEQKVVRNISSVILDGSENWVLQDNSYSKTTTRFTLNQAGALQVNDVITVKCNRFIPSTADNIWKIDKESIGHSKTQIVLRINNSNNIQTVEKLKQWLSQNNITLDYILATPTEETIELPEILKTKGTNIIEVLTKVKPSKIEY